MSTFSGRHSAACFERGVVRVAFVTFHSEGLWNKLACETSGPVVPPAFRRILLLLLLSVAADPAHHKCIRIPRLQQFGFRASGSGLMAWGFRA